MPYLSFLKPLKRSWKIPKYDLTNNAGIKNLHNFPNIRPLEKMKYIPSRTLNLDTFHIFYFSNWSILKIFMSFIQILMKNVKFRPELPFFVIFYIKYKSKQKKTNIFDIGQDRRFSYMPYLSFLKPLKRKVEKSQNMT